MKKRVVMLALCLTLGSGMLLVSGCGSSTDVTEDEISILDKEEEAKEDQIKDAVSIDEATLQEEEDVTTNDRKEEREEVEGEAIEEEGLEDKDKLEDEVEKREDKLEERDE